MYRIAEKGDGKFIIVSGRFFYRYVMRVESGTTSNRIEHALTFNTYDSAKENLELLKEYEKQEEARQNKIDKSNSIVRIYK